MIPVGGMNGRNNNEFKSTRIVFIQSVLCQIRLRKIASFPCMNATLQLSNELFLRSPQMLYLLESDRTVSVELMMMPSRFGTPTSYTLFQTSIHLNCVHGMVT
jgi:hypothetical protein